MTISHASIKPDDDVAVVFAELLGFITCSICAPVSWDEARVIAFAEEMVTNSSPFIGNTATSPAIAAGWRSIDKPKLGLGSPTPHSCNKYPDQRKHWFMVRGEL